VTVASAINGIVQPAFAMMANGVWFADGVPFSSVQLPWMVITIAVIPPTARSGGQSRPPPRERRTKSSTPYTLGRLIEVYQTPFEKQWEARSDTLRALELNERSLLRRCLRLPRSLTLL
jgi:hypothetical protein